MLRRKTPLKRSGSLKRTGALPKRGKPLTRDVSAEKQTATRKRQQKRAREMRGRDFGPHAGFVRSFPCAACGTSSVDRSSHHEPPRSKKGDPPMVERQTPLCGECHTDDSRRARHKVGRDTFERQHGINLREIAAALWQASPFNPSRAP